MNHSEIVSFIWGVADLIRETFKRGKCQDVILPLTVLRRLDDATYRLKELRTALISAAVTGRIDVREHAA
jgi:type I restriction enzyme M protein